MINELLHRPIFDWARAVKIFKTSEGVVAHDGRNWLRARRFSFDSLFSGSSGLEGFEEGPYAVEGAEPLLPPIESQEVWAAGVTYHRSRDARMEESEGSADVYDRVYSAERPELFFKATPHRVVGHRQDVAIRRDSSWNVPEAELTLAINRAGDIIGYTIGNDMSSRSIEGENPLYLPQAKIYDRSCALGPCLHVTNEPLPVHTEIRLSIARDGANVFEAKTRLDAMKRTPDDLVGYLYRHNSFPAGAYLLTGTGIVPPVDFTLIEGDEIAIWIDGIGELVNRVRVG